MDMIDWASSQEELDAKERFWIRFLSTISPRGYNLKDGGANGRPSLESRQRMSQSHKGQKWAPNDIRRRRPHVSPNKGVRYSEARKEQMRQITLARFAAGWKHPMLGRKMTPEQIKANSERRKGKSCPFLYRSIKCVETGEAFKSNFAAATVLLEQGKCKSMAVGESALSAVRNRPNRTAYGYHWVSV